MMCLSMFLDKTKMPVPNSSISSALWILPGLLTGILLLLNPDLDDHIVPTTAGNTTVSSHSSWFWSYHGTEGSSRTDCCSVVTIQRSASTRQLISDRNKTEGSKKFLSPRVHRLPGNVKWVRPHGMG